MKKTLFVLLAFLAFLPATSVPAEEAAKPIPPVRIEADRMESVEGAKAVLFSGNVEAQQGDLLLQAASMTVHYLAPAGDKGTAVQEQRKIEKLLATGNVRVQDKEWTATGDTVEYYDQERKVVMRGTARVWQRNNLITGETIIIFLDEGRSIVERSPNDGERVKAFFYPEDAAVKPPAIEPEGK